MGYFMLVPEDGKTYTANVTFADGTTATPEMPKILADATTINIESSDPDNLKIKLLSDAAFVKENEGKTFFIIAKVGWYYLFRGANQAAKPGLFGPWYPKANSPQELCR